jgi:hypothetical protein
MGLLTQLRLRFRPPVLDDPDFGRLLYMYIPRYPARSYWEGEWWFPPTNTKVTVSLPGTLAGPRESGRAFYLGLPARFDQLIERVRPVLDEVFRQWLGRPLRADVWQDVKLGGFGVEDPDVVPIRWDVGFETVGEKWLGITIPVVGEEPQNPTIDT